MDTNLILASGLAYGLLGALILFLSHCAIYETAAGLVAGYPRVIAKLRLKRHDARFGLAVLGCGIVLQALALYGCTASVELWRYPVCAASAAVIAYLVWRELTARRAVRVRAPASPQRKIGQRVYETRRSFRLRQAAVAEAPKLRALEQSFERRLGLTVLSAG